MYWRSKIEVVGVGLFIVRVVGIELFCFLYFFDLVVVGEVFEQIFLVQLGDCIVIVGLVVSYVMIDFVKVEFYLELLFLVEKFI